MAQVLDQVKCAGEGTLRLKGWPSAAGDDSDGQAVDVKGLKVLAGTPDGATMPRRCARPWTS